MGINFARESAPVAARTPRAAAPSEREDIINNGSMKDRTKISWLFDADNTDDRHRLCSTITAFVAALLAVYLVARYAMQFSSERFQYIYRESPSMPTPEN